MKKINLQFFGGKTDHSKSKILLWGLVTVIVIVLFFVLVVLPVLDRPDEEIEDKKLDVANTEPAKSDENVSTEPNESDNKVSTEPSTIVINVCSRSSEFTEICKLYLDTHPELKEKYRFYNLFGTMSDNPFEPDLISMLKGECAYTDRIPDLYVVGDDIVDTFTQGEYAEYALSYEDLGIDAENKIKEAEIAPYIVTIGTRESDGKVVGLGYQSNGGAFYYRSSIAKEVYGTDDPNDMEKIIGAGSGSFEQFLDAAEQMKKRGYAMISSGDDLYTVIQESNQPDWVTDGHLVMCQEQENYMELYKSIVENSYDNKTELWQDNWFRDMAGKGDRNCFGYFGPFWFMDDPLMSSCGGEKVSEGTFGDWRVCRAPIGFYSGGDWILVDKQTEKKEFLKDFMEWLTLDCSENGFQYLCATGKFGDRVQTTASHTVMKMTDEPIDFLSGQNKFDVFIQADKDVKGRSMRKYDFINYLWNEQVHAYANGEKSREQAITDFKSNVASNTEITVD